MGHLNFIIFIFCVYEVVVEKELSSCSHVDQDGIKNLLLTQDDLQLIFVLTT